MNEKTQKMFFDYFKNDLETKDELNNTLTDINNKLKTLNHTVEQIKNRLP